MARPKDPAERRRLVQQAERKEKTQRALRTTAFVLGGVVVLAGAVYGISKLPQPAPQVHWHATYQFWIDDQQTHIVSTNLFFESYDQSHATDALPAHVHECNPNLIHNEGREGEGSLVTLFEVTWGTKLTSNEVVIPPGMTPTGDYKTDSTHSLALYISHDNGTWAPAPISTPFHDHDRYLLVYGNSTEDPTPKEQAFPPFETSQVC
jgi:hypothetical protein